MNMTGPQVRICNLVMLERKKCQIKSFFDEYDASPSPDWQSGGVKMQIMLNNFIL